MCLLCVSTWQKGRHLMEWQAVEQAARQDAVISNTPLMCAAIKQADQKAALPVAPRLARNDRPRCLSSQTP